MRKHFLALALFSILPFQIACDFEDFGSSDRFREDFQYSYRLKPGGSLTLENFNGSVEILSWEKDSVQVTGAKYASTESQMHALKIDAASTPDSLAIRTIRPSDRHGNSGAKYVLRVPRQVQLSRITSSNGSIRVEDIQGSARLETSNGSVRFRKLSGRLDVRTSNGSVEGSGVDGDANVRTSNGAIRLEQMLGGVEATTSNGSIRAEISRPKERVPFSFETSNGGIDLEFGALSDNEVRARSSNATVTLRLPASARAHISAQTSNHSSVQNELDVVSRGSIGKGQLEGDLNGGGPLIRLHTSNGTIRLLRM